LTELFVEGLVPMETLPGDGFQFHEPTRQIIGAHSRRTFSIGDAVRVRLDKADPIERKLNFSIVEQASQRSKKGKGKRRG
jgi:ribonuclease R